MKDSLWKFWRDMVCLSFKFFKGCPPQILLGPFLNTLTNLLLELLPKSFVITNIWHPRGNSNLPRICVHAFDEWTCLVVINTAPRHCNILWYDLIVKWSNSDFLQSPNISYIQTWRPQAIHLFLIWIVTIIYRFHRVFLFSYIVSSPSKKSDGLSLFVAVCCSFLFIYLFWKLGRKC